MLGPNETLKCSLFITVCALNHLFTGDSCHLNQYWKGSTNNAQKLPASFPLIQHSPRKSVPPALRHFELSNGQFKQMDFKSLPPSNWYTYVLVMFYMFQHWTETFPCRAVTAAVAKVLLENGTDYPHLEELLLNSVVIPL